MKLIDKDALVAEIERLKLCTMDEHMNFYSEAAEGEYHALSNLESFIDTIEVKEMDLEKELDEWMKYGPHTNYPWCTIPDAIKITAEHFFELGMSVSNKAQKGE